MSVVRIEDLPLKYQRQLRAPDPAQKQVEANAAVFNDAVRHLTPAGQSEKALQLAAVAWLESNGWFILYHARTDKPATTRKGVADILAIRNGLLLAAEAKVGKGKARPEQTPYLQGVRDHGGKSVLFYSIAELEAFTKGEQQP